MTRLNRASACFSYIPVIRIEKRGGGESIYEFIVQIGAQERSCTAQLENSEASAKLTRRRWIRIVDIRRPDNDSRTYMVPQYPDVSLT